MSEMRSNTSQPARPDRQELDAALREIAYLHQQLDSLRQEVIWANRLTTLGTMSAVLAHEYNNLLTPIGSYAQLALLNPGDQALTRKALHAAIDGVKHANAVCDATLAFARPGETGEQAPGSVQSAMAQAWGCVEKAFHLNEIQAVVELDDAQVALGTIALQQVLVNLLDNARKALVSHDKPRRVVVQGQAERDGYMLGVKDNGRGIEADRLDGIFDAFVTGSGAQGTGLGLRVCKDLVESAGGWIKAESSEGQGAQFEVWLPVFIE